MNNFHALSNGNGHIEQKSSVKNVAAERACQNYCGGGGRGKFPSVYHPRRPRGSQSGREKRCGRTFQACLKTFAAPFLPAQLTAPGSPRMSVYKPSENKLSCV